MASGDIFNSCHVYCKQQIRNTMAGVVIKSRAVVDKVAHAYIQARFVKHVEIKMEQ